MYLQTGGLINFYFTLLWSDYFFWSRLQSCVINLDMYVCMYVCMPRASSEQIVCRRREMGDVCWRLWRLRKALCVNRSGKSKPEPCANKHCIIIRVCTVRANCSVAVLSRIVYRKNWTLLRPVRCPEIKTGIVHPNSGPANKRGVLAIFGVEAVIVLSCGDGI